ncbi:hypothetical protein B0H10DRAFT_1940233 [Mycena sp. CBHHK59/15]|nr:hypothetical protein B0H10DRAFT_1940233 [Mycena sp. CBHHK59/15]
MDHDIATSASRQPGPQLLDLPNEVILLILLQPDLPSDALLFLSMLSTRLHHLALPIYFERHGIDDPVQKAEFTILDSRRDPLSALQMALFVPAIANISCALPHYQTSTVHPLFPHIRRFRTLIARLTSVSKVTLVLDTPDSICGVVGDGIETWASEFGELLNIILKRGCTSLVLRYGMFFSQAYELRPARLGARPVNAFWSAVRHMLSDSSVTPSEEWGIFQVSSNANATPMELDSEGRTSSTLTHFKIESSMPLLPPCFSWSLSALQHSPIACLEFVGVTLPTKIWSAVLPCIASLVPTLTELNLSDLYGISGSDILLFLAKLPRLIVLTIGYTEYSRHVQSSCPDSGFLPVPKLYHLTTLRAPSTFVSHFLKKPLPSLTSLCISPRRLILGFRGMRHIGRSVSDIVRRLEKHKSAPTISLEILLGRESDVEMAVDLAVVPGDAELLTALRKITRLVIHSDPDVAVPALATLARWIALFPALLHVSLRVRAADAWATIANAQTISEQSPNVRWLELNGKLFDTENAARRPVIREISPFIGL